MAAAQRLSATCSAGIEAFGRVRSAWSCFPRSYAGSMSEAVFPPRKARTPRCASPSRSLRRGNQAKRRKDPRPRTRAPAGSRVPPFRNDGTASDAETASRLLPAASCPDLPADLLTVDDTSYDSVLTCFCLYCKKKTPNSVDKINQRCYYMIK